MSLLQNKCQNYENIIWKNPEPNQYLLSEVEKTPPVVPPSLGSSLALLESRLSSALGNHALRPRLYAGALSFPIAGACASLSLTDVEDLGMVGGTEGLLESNSQLQLRQS